MHFLHKMRKTHFAKSLDPGLRLPHTLLPLTPRFVVTVQHETRSKRLGGLESRKRVQPVKKKTRKPSKKHNKTHGKRRKTSGPRRSRSSETHPDWHLLSTIASAAPLPRPESECEIAEHFKRCRRIGIRIARRVGVEDPEAVFHEAYQSILRDPDADVKAWAYLPYRIKCRAISAYRPQANRARRLPTVPINESLAEMPECPRIDSELPWLAETWRILLEPLTNQEVQAVVLFHFLGWSVSQIASVGICGSTNSAVKTRLSRVREKIRSFSYRPQPSAD